MTDNLLEAMDASTDELEDIFQEFILTRKSEENSLVYGFFEGKDDYSYYGIRIRNYTNKAVEAYDCNGKDNVLILYSMIKHNTNAFKENDLLFFIDKDFNIKNIKDEKIYTTPRYAIENFYITDTALDEFLKGELQISKNSRNNKKLDYDNVVKYYREKRDEFISDTTLLNVWYSLQKNKGSKIRKGDKPDLSRMKSAYHKKFKDGINLELLKELTPNYIDINELELEREKKRLLENPMYNFRGKYYEEFIYKTLLHIIDDANKPKNLFSEKRKVNISLGKNNLISLLSQYADTPVCLNKYLNNILNSNQQIKSGV